MKHIVCAYLMCNLDILRECTKLFQGQELSELIKTAYDLIINNEKDDKVIAELLFEYLSLYGEEEEDHTFYVQRKESYFSTKVGVLRM